MMLTEIHSDVDSLATFQLPQPVPCLLSADSAVLLQCFVPQLWSSIFLLSLQPPVGFVWLPRWWETRGTATSLCKSSTDKPRDKPSVILPKTL